MNNETQLRLSQIKDRVEALPVADWFAGQWSGKCFMDHTHGRGKCNYTNTKKFDGFSDCCVSNNYEQEVIGWGAYGPILSEEQAAFIANSKQDVPFMLDLIAKMKEEISFLKSALGDADYLIEKFDSAKDTIDSYDGECDQLINDRKYWEAHEDVVWVRGNIKDSLSFDMEG